jgi:hypothetical protein
MKQIGIVTLYVMVGLWILQVYGMFTPTNILHLRGHDWVGGFTFITGALIALGLAIVGIISRRRVPQGLFVANQILCWAYVAVPVCILVIAALVAYKGIE